MAVYAPEAFPRAVTRGVRIVRHERLAAAAGDISSGAENFRLEECRRRFGRERSSGAVRVGCFISCFRNDVWNRHESAVTALKFLRASQSAAAHKMQSQSRRGRAGASTRAARALEQSQALTNHCDVGMVDVSAVMRPSQRVQTGVNLKLERCRG